MAKTRKGNKITCVEAVRSQMEPVISATWYLVFNLKNQKIVMGQIHPITCDIMNT